MEQYITNNSLIYSYRNFILLFKTHDYNLSELKTLPRKGHYYWVFPHSVLIADFDICLWGANLCVFYNYGMSMAFSMFSILSNIST